MVDTSWEEEEETETLLALLPSADCASLKPTPPAWVPATLWLVMTALPTQAAFHGGLQVGGGLSQGATVLALEGGVER